MQTSSSPRIAAPASHPGRFPVPVEPANRADLTAVYHALYGELRDKDARQQQVITWALTVLFGTGTVGAFALERVPKLGFYAVATLVGVGTIIFLILLAGIASDRMGIARTLDRFHEAMEMHTPDKYLVDEPLMPPSWRGWGASWRRDTHSSYAGLLMTLVLIAGIVDVALFVLLGSAK